MRSRRLLLLPVVLLASAACCAPAWGATVHVITSEDDVAAAVLTASPGEANRVQVANAPSPSIAVLIEDLGANLTAGAGCVSLDTHHVRCDHGGLTQVIVYAGDGDDIVSAAPGAALEAHGGSGADRLTGADSHDALYGDGGVGDVLAGSGEVDRLTDGDGIGGAAIDADSLDGGPGRDTVSYEMRTAPLTINLGDPAPDGQAGEGDRLTSVEDVVGGRGADRIIGSAGLNEVDGGNGDDRIAAGAGTDIVIGAKGNDTITCGAGFDRVNSPARDRSIDRLARSCEHLTAHEIIDSDYGGEVPAVSVVLRGVRRSGNTIIVRVKCERFGLFAFASCVISGALRGRAGGATLATAIPPLRVRAERRASLRLRLTAAGQRRVRRGQRFRLSINELNRSPGIALLARARAQALVLVR